MIQLTSCPAVALDITSYPAVALEWEFLVQERFLNRRREAGLQCNMKGRYWQKELPLNMLRHRNCFLKFCSWTCHVQKGEETRRDRKSVV